MVVLAFILMVNQIFGKIKNEIKVFCYFHMFIFRATYCAASVATLCQLEGFSELFQNTAEWVARYD